MNLDNDNQSPRQIKKNIMIPEPCHENWSDMTPKEKGRHCDMCDKVVVDFTNNTKEEIVDHLESAEGKTCGRFRSGQIHKPLNQTLNLTKIAASILAITGVQGALFAQGGAELRGNAITVDQVQTQHLTSNSKPATLIGQIIGVGNFPIPNAKVAVFSGGQLIKSSMSDVQGNYKIELAAGTIIQDNITLRVHAKNFEMKSIENLIISKTETALNVVMSDRDQIMLMGKVACTRPIEQVEKMPLEIIHTKGEAMLVPEAVEEVELGEIEMIEEMGDVKLIEERIPIGDTILATDPILLIDPVVNQINEPIEYMLGGPRLVNHMIIGQPITGKAEPTDIIEIISYSPLTTINGEQPADFYNGEVALVEDIKEPIVPIETTMVEVVNPDIDVTLPNAITKTNDPESPEAPSSNSMNNQGINETNDLSGGAEFEIRAYPNPSNDLIYVSINKTGEYDYMITNILGKVIYKGFFIGNKAEFSFRNQNSGIYFISIYEGKEVKKTAKVVIER
ncbi:MAG: T9SS type A sorting domain-containing protein [Flavobacteriales bacterium]|nr:T9SS type A sorting domain-containing protein [Flavobacteriales bacterium]